MRWNRTCSSFLVVAAALLLVPACGGKSDPAEPAEVSASADAAPIPPPLPPYPETDQGVLDGFTAALEARDIALVRRYLAPELGAELTREHDQQPEKFWAGGAAWLKNAKTGMTIATKADDAGKVDRWRALVRFGNGSEESIQFAKVEGKLVIADL